MFGWWRPIPRPISQLSRMTTRLRLRVRFDFGVRLSILESRFLIFERRLSTCGCWCFFEGGLSTFGGCYFRFSTFDFVWLYLLFLLHVARFTYITTNDQYDPYSPSRYRGSHDLARSRGNHSAAPEFVCRHRAPEFRPVPGLQRCRFMVRPERLWS